MRKIIDAINRFARKLNRFLLKNSERYKYRAICNALGLRVIPWQRRFAIKGIRPPLDICYNSNTGLTTGIMLRILMLRNPKHKEVKESVKYDPSFDFSPKSICELSAKYYAAVNKCKKHKIPVKKYDMEGLWWEGSNRIPY